MAPSVTEPHFAPDFCIKIGLTNQPAMFVSEVLIFATQARATPITPRGDLRVRSSWQITTRGEGEPDKAVFLENWAFVSPVVFAHYHA
jgi:hypothetical protein